MTSSNAVKSVPSTLIVDDCEGDVLYTRLMLRRTGRFPYVFGATDGEEALALFLDYERARALHPGRFPPSLMLLDVNMPRMNGLEFLEQLAQVQVKLDDEPGIVIMLTSSTDERDRERVQRFPCVRGYLVKPLTEQQGHDMADRFGVLKTEDV